MRYYVIEKFYDSSHWNVEKKESEHKIREKTRDNDDRCEIIATLCAGPEDQESTYQMLVAQNIQDYGIENRVPRTMEEIINDAGGCRAVSDALGIPIPTCQGWAYAGRTTSDWTQRLIVEALRAKKILNY